ncbi:MAG TPA: hypothetical protein VIL85_11790 [Thermomicrobiales bacterium]|jgi:hypothetical protein
MFTVDQVGEYRTRDGRKAVVLGYNPYGSLFRRWIGYVGESTSERGDDGAYQPGGTSDRDLIGPWVQPATLSALEDVYCAQRDPADHAQVTLQDVLRALASAIDDLNAQIR